MAGMRKRLDRRTFLKGSLNGVQAWMALPFLEIMIPLTRSERALAAANKPLKFCAIMHPNGFPQEFWTPNVAHGASLPAQLPRSIAELSSMRSELTMVSGLHVGECREGVDHPHERGPTSFLTAHQMSFSSATNVQSLDQIIADRIISQGFAGVRSLQLAVPPTTSAGASFLDKVSWTKSTQFSDVVYYNRLMQDAFYRMFPMCQVSPPPPEPPPPGGGPPVPPLPPPPTGPVQAKYNLKILDVVKGDIDRLKNLLGKTDREKVDEYLTSIEEVEREIQSQYPEATASQLKSLASTSQCPSYNPSANSIGGILSKLFELVRIGFENDRLRVAVVLIDKDNSYMTYPNVLSDNEIKLWHHHKISHNGSDPLPLSDEENRRLFAKCRPALADIANYHSKSVAGFLSALNSKQDSDGNSLLHNSVVMYGSGYNSFPTDVHWHYDLPIMLAGRGGGQIAAGRHLDFFKSGRNYNSSPLKNGAPLGNLLVSLARIFGATVGSIGNSNGSITLG